MYIHNYDEVNFLSLQQQSERTMTALEATFKGCGAGVERIRFCFRIRIHLEITRIVEPEKNKD